MNRRYRLTVVLGLALAALSSSLAARQMDQMAMMKNDFKPYASMAHKAVQDEGKLSLVFFHAPWCPVCRAQEPKLLARLNGDFKHVVPFKVDYDSNMELRKMMNVARQSTLILYKGSKEIARLSYKSDDASIDELFAHARMDMGR